MTGKDARGPSSSPSISSTPTTPSPQPAIVTTNSKTTNITTTTAHPHLQEKHQNQKQLFANHQTSAELASKSATQPHTNQQYQQQNQNQKQKYHPQEDQKQHQHQHQQQKSHKKSKVKASSNRSNSHCYSNYNYNNNNKNNSINHSNSHNSTSNSKYFLQRSKHTNNIYSSGATLVEEEDFNELTAVPTATIVIATNANGKVRVSPHTTANGSAVIGTGIGIDKESVRKLPLPLKLTTKTTSRQTIDAPTKNILQRQQATHQQLEQLSPTETILEQKLTAQTSEESQPTELTPLVEADDITLHSNHSPIAITPSSNTNTASSTQRSYSTAIAASVSPTASVGLAATSQFGGGLSPATSAASIISTVDVANPPNIYVQQSSLPTAPTAPPPTVVAAAAAATATTTTYSHNSKTTRSWPVIYRNPHHYDYEALYVQATKPTSGSNHHYHHQPTSNFQIGSSVFKPNCYSNQFAQSILYTSSNEDLSAINEHGDNLGGFNGVGGGTTSGSVAITAFMNIRQLWGIILHFNSIHPQQQLQPPQRLLRV
ncbi:G-box-binding factor-like [Ceratitis capitata]|uniref:G-box-binding factor-like n=1 Tax=Ceratitis capitata TaxID=7213 RepID=UPI0006189033|nr:G-box-binding factor-like [Ceratitis capitata]